MSLSTARRQLLRVAVASASTALLPPARACEFETVNFTLVHPWTRASRAGETSAAVAMVFQRVARADRLIGARTPVAERIELAGPGVGPALDLEIPAGQVTELAERGVHLRLVGLLQPLEMARSYPLTLQFEDAGELRALLNIDYARFA